MLALGLWSVWAEAPLDPCVVSSFALATGSADRPDGRARRVGGAVEKARAVAGTGGARVFLVAGDQRRELEEAGGPHGPRVEAVDTLAQAREVASGRLSELLAHCRWERERAGEVPLYLRGARMEAIRQRVRVTAQRPGSNCTRCRTGSGAGSPPPARRTVRRTATA